MPEKRKDSNGRNLKTGESQRANGTYMYRYTDTTGKKRCCYAPTLKELRDKEQAIQKDLLQGISTVASDMTVAELTDSYLKQYGSAKMTTRANQNFMLSVIRNDPFGAKHIKEVKQSDARLFIIHLRDDLGYASGTMSNFYSFLKRSFGSAIEDELVRKNPFNFNLGTVVSQDSTTRDALTDEERDTFLRLLRSRKTYSKWYNQVVILLETGIRVSELCGLTIQDIDFENQSLRINKQLLIDSNFQRHICPPKTRSGNRNVPLTDTAITAFRDELSHRVKPEHEAEVDGYSGFIFLNNRGQPHISYDIDIFMSRTIERYNAEHDPPLPHITPHVLRHTFITNLYKAGMDAKSIQLIAGHSNIQTTLNVYTHMRYDQVKAEFLKLQAGL